MRIYELTDLFVDTIAGQMRSLKQGGAPPKNRGQHDDSSDGSDTEGDVESESETDTDTDSDDE
jgi:translocation protein SEC63